MLTLRLSIAGCTIVLCSMFLYVMPAGAPYMTNMQGGGEASARVFEGVSEVFLGLAALERTNFDAAEELFKSALDSLEVAQAEFGEIRETEVAQRAVNLSMLSPAHISFLSRLNLPIDDLNGTALIDETLRMIQEVQSSLWQFTENPTIDTYGTLRGQITRLLYLGEIASRLLA